MSSFLNPFLIFQLDASTHESDIQEHNGIIMYMKNNPSDTNQANECYHTVSVKQAEARFLSSNKLATTYKVVPISPQILLIVENALLLSDFSYLSYNFCKICRIERLRDRERSNCFYCHLCGRVSWKNLKP